MELYKQYFNQEVKNMEYGRINWKNGSSGGTPFSAENLNIMDKGIDDAKKEINDTKSSKVSFTSNDSDDESEISWSSVDILTTGETHSSILSKISKMFRNIRYLNKKYDQVNSDLEKHNIEADTAIDLNLDIEYICPCDGYLRIIAPNTQNGYTVAYLNGITIMRVVSYGTFSLPPISVMFLRKGSQVQVSSTPGGVARFYPLS